MTAVVSVYVVAVGSVGVNVMKVVKAEVVDLWIVRLVVFNALFVQPNPTPPAVPVTVKPVGASGGTAKHMGRIMSFSSCPSKWQWSTYSHPKFVGSFVIVTGLPNGLMFVKFSVPPWGCVGSSSLTLFGTWK